MIENKFNFGAAIEGTSGGGTTKGTSSNETTTLVCDHVGPNAYVIAEVDSSGAVIYDQTSGSYRRLEFNNLGVDGVAIYLENTTNIDPSTSTSFNLGPHRINFVVNASPIITFNKKTIPLADRDLEAIRYPFFS